MAGKERDRIGQMPLRNTWGSIVLAAVPFEPVSTDQLFKTVSDEVTQISREVFGTTLHRLQRRQLITRVAPRMVRKLEF